MVNLSVVDLIEYEKWTHYVVVLREERTSRILPIWIGQNEAWSMVQALLAEHWASPSTHDLAVQILQAAQVEISKMSIVALEDEVFQAQVTIKRAGKDLEISGRPSDVIVLSLRLGIALQAEDHLLHKYGVELAHFSEKEPDWGRGLREIAETWKEAIGEAKSKPTPASKKALSAAYQWVTGFVLGGKS